jgi:hypothetical protein
MYRLFGEGLLGAQPDGRMMLNNEGVSISFRTGRL